MDSVTLSLLSVLLSFPVFYIGLYLTKPYFVLKKHPKNDTQVISINKIILWSTLLSLITGLLIAMYEKYQENKTTPTLKMRLHSPTHRYRYDLM